MPLTAQAPTGWAERVVTGLHPTNETDPAKAEIIAG
jgi:hypothetical protein